MAKVSYFRYGMRLRGFAPLCQPLEGLSSVEEGDGKYHNILVYKRMLTPKEMKQYELDDLNNFQYNKLHIKRLEKGMSLNELSRLSGVPRRTLEYYERTGIGLNNCGAEKAILISDILGCDIRDLME